MLMSCSSPRPVGFPHQRRPARSRRSTWYRLANAKSIALIGSGLTMVGVLLSARRDGFQGKATVISRRGQLPRPHAAKGIAQQEIGLARSKRVSGLTSAIAIGCAAAEAHGTPWQAIINGLRSSMQDIWQGLPVEEQARFLRHVRPLWDRPSLNSAWRHPCNGQAMAMWRNRVEWDGESFKLITTRHGATQAEVMTTDLAFNCTGHRADLVSPLI